MLSPRGLSGRWPNRTAKLAVPPGQELESNLVKVGQATFFGAVWREWRGQEIIWASGSTTYAFDADRSGQSGSSPVKPSQIESNRLRLEPMTLMRGQTEEQPILPTQGRSGLIQGNSSLIKVIQVRKLFCARATTLGRSKTSNEKCARFAPPHFHACVVWVA